MKSLAIVIDATSQYTYLYLIKDNIQIINYKNYENQQNLSDHLIEYIDELLKEQKFTFKDLTDCFLVYGPGKFSAMRITSIVAKTLSLLQNLNLYIIDKFDYLAQDNCICVIKSDGKKSFICLYKNGYKYDSPRLIDDTELDNIVSQLNVPIIYNNNNYEFVLKKLNKFKKVDYNFILEYLKSPC